MVQVYGLITDGTYCLIPKKAVESDLWQGERSKFGPLLVNQCGQYALFGGAAEAGDRDGSNAVMRETFEESGVTLKGTPKEFFEIASHPEYKCYAVLVSPEDLQRMQRQMRDNIGAGRVTDGEMQSVEAVRLDQVHNYLGVDQKPDLSPEQGAKKQRGEIKKPGRHSIDWYQDIATEVGKRRAAIQERAEAVNTLSGRSFAAGGEDVEPSISAAVAVKDDIAVHSSGGEFATQADRVQAEKEDVRQKLIAHLKGSIHPYRNDVKTRNEAVQAMVGVIMDALQKDTVTMQKAIDNPSALFNACDANMGSAKMNRFLENHHNARDNIGELFRSQQYKTKSTGKFASLFGGSRDQLQNIAEYVAGVIKKDFDSRSVVAPASSKLQLSLQAIWEDVVEERLGLQ